MLIIVTSFITIGLLYFQIAREDHRWWWTSFFNGGATGIFIFAYSFFYFFHRSNMNGVLQVSFYFGYTGIVAYSFFMMLGFISMLCFNARAAILIWILISIFFVTNLILDKNTKRHVAVLVIVFTLL
jgi:hypothetical protein